MEIKGSEKENLLGVLIDKRLTFEPHVKRLCNKVSQKLNALARVSHYINFEQRRMIMKAFITSQFSYCPLVWMFHSRKSNNRINRLHERSLRIVYNNYNSTFRVASHFYKKIQEQFQNISSTLTCFSRTKKKAI